MHDSMQDILGETGHSALGVLNKVVVVGRGGDGASCCDAQEGASALCRAVVTAKVHGDDVKNKHETAKQACTTPPCQHHCRTAFVIELRNVSPTLVPVH